MLDREKLFAVFFLEWRKVFQFEKNFLMAYHIERSLYSYSLVKLKRKI